MELGHFQIRGTQIGHSGIARLPGVHQQLIERIAMGRRFAYQRGDFHEVRSAPMTCRISLGFWHFIGPAFSLRSRHT
jgi:hypothetical protein